MKTIIAGSRTITDMDQVSDAVRLSGFDITEVCCGMAPGADYFGCKLADLNKIPVKFFKADWMNLGKAAGPMRNQQMADYADALIAVWDGVSRGTKDMIDRATKKGLKVYIHRI